MALNLSPEDLAAVAEVSKKAAADGIAEYFTAFESVMGEVSELTAQGGVDLSPDAIAAIGAEIARQLTKAGPAAASDESAIVGNDGPWYWTAASVKYLPPGRRFLSARSLPFCRTDEDRALVDGNCGLDANGNPTGKFGDGFAQADSNLTPRLQGAFTSMVHPVKRTWLGLTLDRTRAVRQSDDGFPLDFACRGITPQEEAEWCRLTGEHIKYTTGAWKN